MTTSTLDRYANLRGYPPEKPLEPHDCHCGEPAEWMVIGYEDRCGTFAEPLCQFHLDEIAGFQSSVVRP